MCVRGAGLHESDMRYGDYKGRAAWCMVQSSLAQPTPVTIHKLATRSLSASEILTVCGRMFKWSRTTTSTLKMVDKAMAVKLTNNEPAEAIQPGTAEASEAINASGVAEGSGDNQTGATGDEDDDYSDGQDGSEEEEEEEEQSGDRGDEGGQPGKCTREGCKFDTLIPRARCCICNGKLHDVCDVGESVHGAEVSEMGAARPLGLKSCSESCWQEEKNTKHQQSSRVANPPPPRKRKGRGAEIRTKFASLATERQGQPLSPATEQVAVIDVSSDEEDLFDDGEVIPVEGDTRNQTREIVENVLERLNIQKLNLDAYEIIPCVTDLTVVPDPKHVSRKVSSIRVAELAATLKRDKMWTRGIGSYAVVERETLVDGREQRAKIDETGVLTGNLQMADGRHRKEVNTELAKKDPKWLHELKTANVTLWRRKDGKFVSAWELLAISRHLNNAASNVAKPSFSDSIYSAVSVCRLFRDQNNTRLEDVSVRTMAGVLAASGALGLLAERQLQRYAQIALKLAKSNVCFEKFFGIQEDLMAEGKSLGVVHIAENVLSEMDELGFAMAMESLKLRLLEPWNVNSESFEKIRKEFYLGIRALYREVVRVAELNEKSAKEVLDSEVVITAGQSRRIEQIILHQFHTYGNTKASRTKKGAQKRVKLIQDNLKKLFDDIGENESPKPKSPEPPKSPELPKTPEPPNSPEPPKSPEVPNSPEPPKSPEVPKSPEQAVPETGGGKAGLGKRKRKTVDYNEDDADAEGSGDEYSEGEDSPQITDSKRKKVNERTGDATAAAATVEALKSFSMETLKSIMAQVGLQVITPPRSSKGRKDPVPAPARRPAPNQFPSTRKKFDDRVPDTLPVGFAQPTPYEGPLNPQWARLALRPPSCWTGGTNPIQHVGPFLRMIHISQHHRANVVIRDPTLLQQNHHMVFWRAAYNWYKRYPLDVNMVCKDVFKDVPEDLRAWAAVHSEDSCSLSYFSACRSELGTKGFCILEGMLDDARTPLRVGPVEITKPGNGNFFIRLREEAESSFLARKDDDNPKEWNWIVNEGIEKDSELGKNGVGRFLSTNYGVTTAFEGSPLRVWAVSSRALLDARVGQAIAAMRVWDYNPSEKLRGGPMYIPNSGGRWLITSGGCERQRLHLDFASLDAAAVLQDTGCPGYFTICTGDREVPLWVCEGSHRIVASTRQEDLRKVAEMNVVEMVRIPPYSIFVGRGDVFHAGCGDADYDGDDGRVRYHMYFKQDGQELSDAVYVNDDFCPRFESTRDRGSVQEDDYMVSDSDDYMDVADSEDEANN